MALNNQTKNGLLIGLWFSVGSSIESSCICWNIFEPIFPPSLLANTFAFFHHLKYKTMLTWNTKQCEAEALNIANPNSWTMLTSNITQFQLKTFHNFNLKLYTLLFSSHTQICEPNQIIRETQRFLFQLLYWDVIWYWII